MELKDIWRKLNDIFAVINEFITGADGITAVYVPCQNAQPATYPLPDIKVPRGFRLVLLARNPVGPNAGIIWVSGSQTGAGGNTQAYPLVPNATISYGPKSAKSIWLGATVAGEGVYVTVEQKA